ncbi:unnamed protein product [Fusarium equiseti]|uniref:Uncharacterized protein n=1 Tax=Fusarium equiseti TaxID=61235 RepID=A0A8J2IDY2_FUSEQ|nr:unnamed protein product [Fusarium equiseti]
MKDSDLFAVDSNIAGINYLGTLQCPSDLASTLDSLFERIQDAWEPSWSRNDTATVALFRDNKVKTINDLIRFFPMIKGLNDIAKDIKTQLDPFNELLPRMDYTKFAISTIQEQNKLASMEFGDIEQELGIDQNEDNREVFDKLYAI